jgi:hypothetical protein
MKLIHVIVLLLFSLNAFSQNLMEERIWKISSQKRSVFLDNGVFHHVGTQVPSSLNQIRSSFVQGRGYERVVLDFSTPVIPKLYGHISKDLKKVSLDLFSTKINPSLSALENTKYINKVNVLVLDDANITLEFELKEKLSFDIFYLENPGRLVIDIRP